MNIDNFKINDNSRVFIIAELSANHNGSKKIALDTVKAAKRSGANCIKLQTYTPQTITIDSKRDDFMIKDTIWKGQNLFELYKKAYTPWQWHEDIFNCAKEIGISCFSSPFDSTSVEFLEKLNVPAYKIASFEITDIPLIELVASKGKPVIISTGIASEKDIERAINACKKMNNNNIALLKCTSSYPAPIDEANICMIKDFKDKYGVISGLSDHTLGYTVPIISIAYGAKIIEKHFILDKSIGGPDSSFSMDEKEFTQMVKEIRNAEKCIGKISYSLTEKQKKGKKYCRSLYVVNDINIGDVITEKNVKSIRPGYGLHPKYYKKILGKKVNYNLKKGDRFELKYLKKKND